MAKEIKELIEARKALSKFEKSIDRTESLNYLSNATSLLDEIISGDFSSTDKKIAENIYSSLSKRVSALVDNVLKDESVEIDKIEYLKEIIDILGEGTEEINLRRSKLEGKETEVLVRGFTTSEIEDLIKLLKEKRIVKMKMETLKS